MQKRDKKDSVGISIREKVVLILVTIIYTHDNKTKQDVHAAKIILYWYTCI